MIYPKLGIFFQECIYGITAESYYHCFYLDQSEETEAQSDHVTSAVHGKTQGSNSGLTDLTVVPPTLCHSAPFVSALVMDPDDVDSESVWLLISCC